jgi:hypothetical protein
MERNQAYEAFSAACNFCLRTTDNGTESRRVPIAALGGCDPSGMRVKGKGSPLANQPAILM